MDNRVETSGFLIRLTGFADLYAYKSIRDEERRREDPPQGPMDLDQLSFIYPWPFFSRQERWWYWLVILKDHAAPDDSLNVLEGAAIGIVKTFTKTPTSGSVGEDFAPSPVACYATFTISFGLSDVRRASVADALAVFIDHLFNRGTQYVKAQSTLDGAPLESLMEHLGIEASPPPDSSDSGERSEFCIHRPRWAEARGSDFVSEGVLPPGCACSIL